MAEIQETQNPFKEEWEKKPMRKPRVGALIINVSIGQSGQPLERAKTIIRQLTNREPVETIAKQTWRDFGIRKHQPIGCKVTLRGKDAEELLNRLFEAVDREISASSFDQFGNFAFGIREHIDIPGMKYDPDLGIIGMDVIVQMIRPGYRLRYRKIGKQKIPKKHKLTREESIAYVREHFNVQIK